jgi:hypothetical protein
MRITKETVTALKYLSSINQNLLIKAGSTLNTISPQRNVLAEVKVLDVFPKDFAIYDLSEFLGVLSLFTDPEVDFTEKFAKISSGGNMVKYYAADPSILVVPSKPLKYPGSDVSFSLPADTLALVLRTAGVLRSSDISLVGDGESLSFEVSDLKNATANCFTVELGETDQTFRANFKAENLKLVAGEYEVGVSSKKISQFKNEAFNLTAFIALEASSTWA